MVLKPLARLQGQDNLPFLSLLLWHADGKVGALSFGVGSLRVVQKLAGRDNLVAALIEVDPDGFLVGKAIPFIIPLPQTAFAPDYQPILAEADKMDSTAFFAACL